MKSHNSVAVRHYSLVFILEYFIGAFFVRLYKGKIIRTENHILCRNGYRLTVRRLEEVVCSEHKKSRFSLRLSRQRYVNSHLVTVKVGVVSGTDKRVEFKSLTLNKHRLKRLNTESVKCRRAVKKNRMLFYHHFESVPYLIRGALYHFSRGFDIRDRLGFNKTLHNKRLKELKRHFLRKTALIHFKLRAYNYNRTSRIVNTLTEKVLTETSLLALKHIGKRFERAVIRTCHGLTAAAIVNKRINRLLKHTLFIADYYIRSMKLKQSFKSVIAVDNTSV